VKRDKHTSHQPSQHPDSATGARPSDVIKHVVPALTETSAEHKGADDTTRIPEETTGGAN
jgi:hypothetical protein